MKRGFRNRVFVATLMCAQTFASVAAATEPETADSLTSIGDWSLFNDEEACWVASSPDILPDEHDDPEKVLMFVSFFKGSAEPQISFYLDGFERSLMFARTGLERLLIFKFEDMHYSEFPDEEYGFLMEMLNRDRVDLLTRTSTQVQFSFSLEGFRDAYNEAARVCELNAIGIDGAIGNLKFPGSVDAPTFANFDPTLT